MIVVDASAICAIILREAEAEAFEALLARRGEHIVSPVNAFEALCVLETKRPGRGRVLVEGALEFFQIEVAALEPRQAELAFEAHRRFGKGRHPAALNLGDCFAYALARQHGVPLLFKGEDFRRTDVRCAL